MTINHSSTHVCLQDKRDLAKLVSGKYDFLEAIGELSLLCLKFLLLDKLDPCMPWYL